MSDEITKLREDFTTHQIDEAGFRSEVSAYIKNAAQDINDIKNSFDKETDEQWAVLKELGTGLNTEREERKLADQDLKGNIRMAGYARIVAVLTSITLLIVGGYLTMFWGG